MTINEAREFIQQALPASDQISIAADVIDSFAAHAVMLRNDVQWCKNLPEDIFLAYVLFPRVNNEHLERHRESIYQELFSRIRPLTMRQAALEVNFWCLEKATYCTTDNRTASANTVMRKACGRCGEESTLLVCALRAVGIPARQIYVPRWAHCDDNHAWVEAYVDGAWHYMGACEPEMELDSGWFTSAASRAMLIHTVAYGVCPAGEEMLSLSQHRYILNRTKAYADCTALQVRIHVSGKPLAGAQVAFELFNEGELVPLSTMETGRDGCLRLSVGLGGLHLQISHEGRFITRVIDTRKTASVDIDFSEGKDIHHASDALAFFAPVETRFNTPNESAMYGERLAKCREKRFAYTATFATGDSLLEKAAGNAPVIEGFLAAGSGQTAEKRLLLHTLAEKDLADITADVLSDALETALPYRNQYPEEVFAAAVLCPRVEFEHLYPVRRAIRAFFADQKIAFGGAADVFAWVHQHVADNGLTPQQAVLPADPYAALTVGCTDRRTRTVLAVTICRAFGFPVRLSPVSQEPEQYLQSGYVPLFPQEIPTASLTLKKETAASMLQRVHFTLGKLENGAYKTLSLPQEAVDRENAIALCDGDYRLLTGIRQIDGSILANATYFQLKPGERKILPMHLPGNRIAGKLHSIPLPALKITGISQEKLDFKQLFVNGGIVSVIAPSQEPTEHLLFESVQLYQRIIQEGRRVLYLVRAEADAEHPTLARSLRMLGSNACVAVLQDADALMQMRQALRVGDPRLPFSMAVNPSGNALFAFANYNIGTIETLLDILNADAETQPLEFAAVQE
ncbi:MAG: transglutaminase-like domain-containing protein [Eubacteriales bacterium]|nr:transglutaminase-like domain-containing protein [Eubacteriales bacterium]